VFQYNVDCKLVESLVVYDHFRRTREPAVFTYMHIQIHAAMISLYRTVSDLNIIAVSHAATQRPFLMERRLPLPGAISPPEPPALGRISERWLATAATRAASLGSGVFPSARAREIVNVTNALPDGSLVYCVACDGGAAAHDGVGASSRDRGGGGGGALPPLREGWLPLEVVEEMSPEEELAIPAALRLSGRQLHERLTLAHVVEEWQDQEDDSFTLRLLPGDLLQLSTVRDDGWAYGWSLEKPSRRGWFPVSLVQRVEPSLASLAPPQDKFLTASASEAMVSFLRTCPCPPAQDLWKGTVAIPNVVAESAREEVAKWEEMFERMDAQHRQAAETFAQTQETSTSVDGCWHDEEAGDGDVSDLFSDERPDDRHPLMVCKVTFKVPAVGSCSECLLTLEIGDLVRVTSFLDSQMLFGFLDGRPEKRGWFPSKAVQPLAVALDAEDTDATDALQQISPPPWPQLLPCLRGKMGL